MDFVTPVLFNPAFSEWSGAATSVHHHYGDGGLLKHTYEVVEYARLIVMQHNSTCALDKRINWAELLVSIIWHDWGKIWDYIKVDGVWGGTLHKRKIHHISRSALEWEHHCDNVYDDDFHRTLVIDKLNVTHNILAHHGQREWGSPVAPESREAWVLHLADNLSARLDDCDKHDILKH